MSGAAHHRPRAAGYAGRHRQPSARAHRVPARIASGVVATGAFGAGIGVWAKSASSSEAVGQRQALAAIAQPAASSSSSPAARGVSPDVPAIEESVADERVERLERQRSEAASRAARRAATEAAQRKAKAAATAAAAARVARDAAAHRWVMPLAQPVQTSSFGPRWGRNHNGLDFAATVGTPLRAMSSGTVTFAGEQSGYGTLVQITYWDGTVSYYGHLSKLSAVVGQKVAPGQVVAASGNTGRSTGPHLHLEIRPDGGAPIDPRPWLLERKAGLGAPPK